MYEVDKVWDRKKGKVKISWEDREGWVDRWGEEGKGGKYGDF